MLILCHYIHCCLLKSLECLSVPHKFPSLGFLSLCPELFPIVCKMAVSTLNCTVRCFCLTMSPVVFYIMSTVCQEFLLYRLFFLCHYVSSFLLQYVHCNSVPHTVPSVGPVSLIPQLSSIVLHCLSVRHTLLPLALC